MPLGCYCLQVCCWWQARARQHRLGPAHRSPPIYALPTIARPQKPKYAEIVNLRLGDGSVRRGQVRLPAVHGWTSTLAADATCPLPVCKLEPVSSCPTP